MARARRQPGDRRSSGWSHWAAPAAFLAAATIAIVLVATALNGNRGDASPTTGATTAPAARTTTAKHRTPVKTVTTKSGSFYVVVAGDTFGTIAEKNGTTVAALEQLNPGVSTTSLHIGQKIRVA